MRYKRLGAALCASLLLCTTVQAEEKHIGNLIYVPAMTVQAQTGMHALRVEGLALEKADDEPARFAQIAGAEFGVYVVSSSGELTPWANPLYPSEPMRIRTGEGETRFSLPQGTEFFLRQESAPEGYRFDSETLIPVTGEEIVVRNAMAGELVITARDTLGQPVAGAQFTVVFEDGTTTVLTADEDGQAVLACEQAGVYDVMESFVPEGVYDAIGMNAAREGDVVRQDLLGVAVRVEEARRTRVTFEHPASGSVQLNMQLSEIDENAQTVLSPLAGVRMEIYGQRPMVIETDETGIAQAALLEGEYTVRLSYTGDAILPVAEGMMIVQSGATTVIELVAAAPRGRVMIAAQSTRAIEGGSVTLVSDATGEEYGPYGMDAEGFVISDPLAPGVYHMTVEAPGDMQLGEMVCGSSTAFGAQEMPVEVVAGEVTQATVQLLVNEKQSYQMLTAQIGETGETQQTRVEGVESVQLLDESGAVVAELLPEEGYVSVHALTGVYTLRMSEKDAKKLGVMAQSLPFELPSVEESISFPSVSTRMILTSVDENGTPVAGAVYSVMDSEGKRFDVETDETGEAVTPLMAAGEAHILTIQAPAAHDEAQETVAVADVGSAVRVQMVHEQHGRVSLAIQLQKIDERGETAFAVLPGASIEITPVRGKMEDSVEVISGADGLAQIQLPEGDYTAAIQDTGVEGARLTEGVYFSVANTQETQIRLHAYDVNGAQRVQFTGGELSDEQMAQVRFELTGEDGAAQAMSLVQGAFYAGNLPAGTYTLRQTQMPQGYTLGKAQRVSVSGGEVASVNMPLEEYAVLSVSKTGLTFNDRLQTFLVPLTGEYGVYTEQNGEIVPYPSQDAQMRVWSNVTPQQIAQGRAAQVKLPAALEGTVYYLKEMEGAQGFTQDETYYELVLSAGENRVYDHVVSSDRGFFELEQRDALTGSHVAGGTYELVHAKTLESVFTFEMGDAAYRNPMSIPIGEYLLRQIKAAPGYAMSADAQQMVRIEPYLTQGGMVTQVEMTSAYIPQTAQLDLIEDVYAANEQGLTLLSVDMGALLPGETLLLPQMTLDVRAQGTERSDIKSVLLDGATDGEGGSYVARVEYCLADGGWQPSDARMTQVLSTPAAVSLSDVEDDVCAVRVTYLNAETGEEKASSGFAPGRVTLNVHASAEADVQMTAKAQFTGKYAYTQALFGEQIILHREDAQDMAFTAQGNGLFATVPAGRDGRISGMAFFDEDADGVVDAEEKSRYAGMSVSLLSAGGEVLSTVRTDGQGRYSFDALSGGTYAVQFEAGEDVVFSSGSLYSEHMTSSVADTRYGQSQLLTIDGENTDYLVNAGCLFAASLNGAVVERTEQGEAMGFGGLIVEMRRIGGDQEEEPVVVVTGDSGEYEIGGILPGRYEARMELPQGYLSEEAPEGMLVRELEFAQGGKQTLGLMTIERAAALSGSVHIDSDGDGVFGGDAKALEAVRVKLLRVEDGHTQTVAETATDMSGAYAFDMLPSGAYSVLFELPGEWAFTRFGADSLVCGAAAQSGSTESILLVPGETRSGVNAGVTLPAMLTVSVFKDTQLDGQKGIYEEMLEGVSVSLIRLEEGEDAQEMTLVTGADGVAQFDSVSPGEYVLAYQMPGAWRSTKQVDPVSTQYPVSCVPQSTLSAGRSAAFTLGMGQTDAKLYIGAMLSGSISGTMYYDDNADARMSDDEAAASGMQAELLNAQGETVAKTHTDDNGVYTFDGLAPGRYRVRFTALEGCGFAATERTMVRGGVQESDEHVASTRPITIASGDKLTTADAGIVRLGTVSGAIWEDSDADRAIGENERALAGVEVALMNGTGRNILATAVTDEDGIFTFAHMRPGEYMLRVSAPEGYVFSGALSTGVLPVESIREQRAYSSAFTLLGGAMVDNIGYGLFTQGTIRGSIWQDADFDAQQKSGEEGLRGATLTLYDESGDETAVTTSQRSGEFVFGALMPGEYTLKVELPEGYVFTRAGGASLAEETGESSAMLPLGTLAMGETIDAVTFGALRPASVGGVIWMDRDDDGRRQVSDSGMQGIRALLINERTQESVETFTDENGTYRFEGVLPGTYSLAFELETGYAFARNATGTKRVSCIPQVDALYGQSEAFIVLSGANMLDKDVGVVGVGTVEGSLWEDSTYDGKPGKGENAIAGATIELVDAKTGKAVSSVHSREDGRYLLEFVRMGEYALRVSLPSGMIFTRDGVSAIADTDATEGKTKAFAVAMGESFKDIDFGAIVPANVSGRLYVDANENGAENAQEAGLSGAVITMMQGGTVVAACETDGNGAYAFETLRPGEYRVRVALPADTLFTQDNVLVLADPDATEGEMTAFEVSMGEMRMMDAVGVVHAASIRGMAWSDDNVNGRADDGEPALTGTMAQLISMKDQRVVASAMVDENGAYAFELLRSGEYAVQFTLPQGRLFADALDESDSSSVAVVPGNVGMTDVMQLAMGEKMHTVNVGGILPGSIGDVVWLDENGNGLQDYKEPQLAGVQLTLLRVERDGTVLDMGTTISDEYGFYRFGDLRPGTYIVRAQVQEGDQLTFSFGAPLGEIDSDVDPDTGCTAEIALASGQTLRNVDIGFVSVSE